MDAARRSELVIRPSLENRPGNRRIGELFPAPIFGILGFVAFLGGLTLAIERHFSWFTGPLTLTGVVCLVLFAASRLAFANVSIYLRAGRIGRTNLLGVRTEFPLAQVQGLELISVVPSRAPVGPVPKLILLSKSGQSLTQVASADYFSLADIRRLAAAAGLEITGSWDTAMSPEELISRHPEGDGNHARELDRPQLHMTPTRVRILAVIAVVCVVAGVGAVPMIGNSAGAAPTAWAIANIVSVVAFVLAIGCLLLLRLWGRSTARPEANLLIRSTGYLLMAAVLGLGAFLAIHR
jgi:hypothetical protein